MATFSLPPLANWQDFERLCCDLWQRMRGVPANLHGRQGQPQHGVDVYLTVEQGERWVGVQCKETKTGFLSKAALEAEVEKARKFKPRLTEFVLATTAPNDAKAQEWAREITAAQGQRGAFPVTIYGWDDICRELAQHLDLVRHYFPDFSWPEERPEPSGARVDDPLEALRLTYLANLYAELEPVPMAVFGSGSNRGETRLHEVFISLDVEAGFRLPLASEAHPLAEMEAGAGRFEPSRKLGRRYHAEAAALVKAEQIPPLEKEPYSRRFTAVEVAAEAPRLVLTGPAGSGKSTFGRYLALCLTGERLGRKAANLALLNRDQASAAGAELAPDLAAWPHGTPLPFFVELRKLVADPTFPASGKEPAAHHLFDYLVSKQADGELRPVLQRALREESGVLVILDGLDETPAAETTRERLKQVIEGFARAWPGCRILVTSRPYAYDQQRWRLEDFAAERLAPFDQKKRAAFVRGWYEHLAQRGQVDRDLVQPRSEDLIRQLKGTSYLKPLAERPLMLTMITDLHASEGGRLPGGRAALYERSVGLLLDRWNHERHGANVAERLGIDASRLRQALERLAYEVHKDRGQTAEQAAPITDVELWQALSAERAQEPKIDTKVDDQEVRAYLHQRSGILLGESPEVYRFPHRSYQEYFAACYLTQKRFPRQLVEELQADPKLWREVFLLAVGKMSDPSFAAWALLEALVPRAPTAAVTADDPRFEHALCAGLAVDETGLWQNVQEQDEGKLEKIRQWLQGALKLGALSPLDRAAAGRVLGRLGDQRKGIGLGADGVPEIDWVAIPPGPFLMGDEKRAVTLHHGFQIARYPVTNAQYQAFVADGGYTEAWRQCWTDEGWEWKTEKQRQGPDDHRREVVFLLANHPRVGVAWYEAWAFSRWLGEKLGQPVVLPSEHQWERAARGGNGREYPWGDTPDVTRMNCEETEIGFTCAVGMFPRGASPEGVLDLSGNVLEWTASAQTRQDELAERPAELAEIPRFRRVLRGGGYGDSASGCRSAYRSIRGPWGDFWDQGFRVLLSSAPQPAIDS